MRGSATGRWPWKRNCHSLVLPIWQQPGSNSASSAARRRRHQTAAAAQSELNHSLCKRGARNRRAAMREEEKKEATGLINDKRLRRKLQNNPENLHPCVFPLIPFNVWWMTSHIAHVFIRCQYIFPTFLLGSPEALPLIVKDGPKRAGLAICLQPPCKSFTPLDLLCVWKEAAGRVRVNPNPPAWERCQCQLQHYKALTYE